MLRSRITVAICALAVAATGATEAFAQDTIPVSKEVITTKQGCSNEYTRKQFHKTAAPIFKSRTKVTKKEKQRLSDVLNCQRHRGSEKNLRDHLKRYKRSHYLVVKRYVLSHGIGKLNRVFPEHGLYDAPGNYFMQFDTIRRVFEVAGSSPREAYIFATIARGESGGGRQGGYPGIRGDDPGGTKGWGLVQCTPGVWGAIAISYMYSLGGESQLRNPFKNAKMAIFLLRVGGWGQWYGTRYRYDPGNVASALTRADRRWIKFGGRRTF